MRVLISGAGIAGPTLAYFLAKSGKKVTIVEKSQYILPHGQNVDIKGGALTILKKMGLMGEIERLNTTEKGTVFINSQGKPFAPFPVREGHTTSITSEFEILRGDLALILYEASKDLPNVQYLFGTTVKEVVSNDSESVKVRFNNDEIHEFDLLVAADGLWSKVRKQCFPPEDVKVVQLGSYTVYFTIPRQSTDNDWWNIYFGLGSRLISLRPDPHGSIRAMFTRMPRGDAQRKLWQDNLRSDRHTQEDLVKKQFADAGWQATRLLEAMESAPDFYFQPSVQIKMSRWSNSRVVCLGDTAYCPSPLTGMGTTLAITGAYVLAGELSKLDGGEHPRRALEAYEGLLRPFVEEEQKVPFFLPEIAHPETAWRRWAYQSVLRVFSWLAAIPWITNRLTDGERLEESFPWPQYQGWGTIG